MDYEEERQKDERKQGRVYEVERSEVKRDFVQPTAYNYNYSPESGSNGSPNIKNQPASFKNVIRNIEAEIKPFPREDPDDEIPVVKLVEVRNKK